MRSKIHRCTQIPKGPCTNEVQLWIEEVYIFENVILILACYVHKDIAVCFQLREVMP